MAALMNVRYLKAIQEKSPEERSRQIDELEGMLKECVENLRGSVYNLKELDENISLQGEVRHIIDKFDELGLVKIHLDSDDKIENAPIQSNPFSIRQFGKESQTASGTGTRRPSEFPFVMPATGLSF